MEEATNTSMNEELPKKGRGGARPGAGRKKLYEDTLYTRRLKCRCEINDLARTCITILNSLSKRRLSDIFATNLNGEETERKGGNRKTWIENDALSTPWSITVNEEYDERIFALAFILENPQYVRIECMHHNGSVQLRWQQLNEIGRIMMTYGSLMARRNRLKSEEQTMLDKIPHLGKHFFDFNFDFLDTKQY